MVHVAKLDFNGDSNLGLYGIATDSYVLLGQSVQKKHLKELEEIFGVPVIQTRIYGTSLVGIFAIGTSKVLLVTNLIFDKERKQLEKDLKKIGVKLAVLKTEKTALGNNISTNDTISFVSTEYTKDELKQIEKALGTKAIQMNFAESELCGSTSMLTNKGGIFTPDLDDGEIKKIEKAVGFEIGLGTVNMGSPMLSSGIIANSNGFIVGRLSSGFEIGRIDESLKFL